MNLTSLGVGSGIDLESIVEAFINAEAIPQEIRLQKKEEKLSLEVSGLGTFKSALSTFDGVLAKLSASDAFSKQVVTASSEDISVDTNGFASNGEFDIEVEQLALGSQLKSLAFTDSSDTVGSGTLTFDVGGNQSFTVDVGGSDNLSVIRDKINAKSDNFGVTANIINSEAGSYLVFDSQVTGGANQLTVATSDASLNSISVSNTNEQPAQDAIIYINANGDYTPENRATSSTNEFKNIIEDVTITAEKVNLGTPTTLTIAQDEENGTTLVNEFVDGFNALIDSLTGLAAPKAGRLAFDPSIRQVKQQLSDLVINSVSGLSGAIQSLNDIGVDLTKTGKLEISTFSATSLPSGTERLSNALKNNLDQVGEIFASTNGIAVGMETIIGSYIDSNGSLTTRLTSLNEELGGIEQEYEDLEARLRDYEDTLRKRFTFLDSTVAQYTATGNFLTSALAGLQNSKDK